MLLGQMELDPQLDLVLGGPPPPRAPVADPPLADVLAAIRPELCATLGMDPADDAAWAEVTDGAAERVESVDLKRMRVQPRRDSWVPFRRADPSSCHTSPRGLGTSLGLVRLGPPPMDRALCSLHAWLSHLAERARKGVRCSRSLPSLCRACQSGQGHFMAAALHAMSHPSR